MRVRCPDAILMADIHLRSTIPKCRTDDFILTQRDKLTHICDLVDRLENKYGNTIPVIAAGDIYHSHNPSPWLISEGLRHLPQLIAIPGQHDLPQHNLKNLEKSGLWTLYEADHIFLFQYGGETKTVGNLFITGFPYGEELKHARHIPSTKYSVAIIHRMVYKGRKPFPGAKGMARSVIRKLKGYDLIVSGDNHIPFKYKYKDQLLVNCGSMTRQRASETHEPVIWFWYAEENEAYPYVLPHDKNVISREHIDRENDRKDRISAYTERLSAEIELSLHFKDNLKEIIVKNKVSKPVQEKVYEAMP